MGEGEGGMFQENSIETVYYLGWNRSPAQVGCMRQVLGPGALGKPRGSGWRGRWEGGSGWGTHVIPWLFHFNVWQNSLQTKKIKKKISILDFPGDPVVRSSAASVRDMGLIPGPGGFLMSWGNWACAAQLLSPGPQELQQENPPQWEARASN